MKHLFTLLFLVPVLGFGQNNLVITTPNSQTPGGFNTLIGFNAGQMITTGYENTIVGLSAGLSNTTGNGNIFLGNRAGSSNTTGQINTILGYYAGQKSTTANSNVFVGGYAGQETTTGGFNTYVGYLAGQENITGGSNAFFGGNSGQKNTNGNFNTFLGIGTGFNNTIGTGNIYLGYRAGYYNTVANNNILIGLYSGSNLTTGNNNVMLGAYTQPSSSSNIQNAVAIGTNARVALDNAIVLGDPYNTSVAVGIGTDSPRFPLDVRGIINLRNNGTIKFSHLSNPLFQGTTDQFLTVNEQGETVLAKHRLRIDNVNQWSDKVFSATYSLRPLSSVATYIQQHGHLPGVPSAEEVVKEGVDLVKINATLLEKVEELTLYSIEQENRAKKQDERINQLESLIKQLIEKK